MEITSRVDPLDGRYTAQISVTKFTAVEAEVIAHLGPFVVDAGGTFTSGPLSFTLPTRQIAVPDQVSLANPITQTFDSADEAAGEEDVAGDKAELWRTTMITRLTAGLTTLRETPTAMPGSYVTTVDTTP